MHARAQQSWMADQQMRLTEIAAPTGNESRRARAVQQMLHQLGTAVCTIDDIGNVHNVIGTASSSPIVCLAHLDAVYDTALAPAAPIPVRRDGMMMFGAGIGDNGRGLASLLLLSRVLQRPDVTARLRRPVHLVATVGEEGEGNLRGAHACFDAFEARGIVPHAAVAIDGPGDESIVHHAVGSHRFRVAIHGPGGHSWLHAADANPLHILGEFIARAARMGNAHRRDALINITRMGGGEAMNSIPQEGWVDVELRGTSAEKLASMRHELLRLSQQLTPPTLRAELTVLGDRPAGVLDAEHPLVRSAVNATRAVGVVPRAASASTDANVPLARGIPAIAIGAGGTGGDAHTSREWYDDTHAGRGLERLVRLILELAVT